MQNLTQKLWLRTTLAAILSAGLTVSGTGPALAADAITKREPAVLQIRVVDGEGAVYAVGSRATRGLTVQITDETGRPLDGVTVSFRLPDDGPGGVFSGGLKSEVAVTRPDGRASVWGMQWNRSPGAFQIRITANKDDVRAGAVSSQYLSDAPGAKASASSGFVAHRGHKVLLISLLAVGAAAGGGLAMGLSSGKATALPAPIPILKIGLPTSLIIGNP